ncbi:hypothetical protein [Bradyrhizobium sp. McL0616]|uniref:hypothetical protein n=1 Tax=Bradyrhizobium sp. McL0616 TaxID=3415674 RepID=UPI003CF8F1D6
MSYTKPQNALTHGLYSQNIVLDCENEQDFLKLWEAFRAEYLPQQVSEEAAVLEMAKLQWIKRRLDARLKEALTKRRDVRASGTTASSDGSDGIGDQIRALAKSHLEAAQVTSQTIGKHVERISNSNETPGESNIVEFEKLTTLAKELNVSGTNLVTMLNAAEKQRLDQIERIYDPDIMERELKILADIDRRIEKVLKRLVMIKEFKKYYVAKDNHSLTMIESPGVT